MSSIVRMQLLGKQATIHALALALCFSSSHPVLLANPSGGSVVYGSAVFQENAGSLQIQQGSGALIIDWQDFSIASGETTRFIQPNAAASALNRVVSDNISEIYGQLEANGAVYLINPNGIVFGENSRIDAASFTASTLDVANNDFLNGDSLTFRADAEVFGQIINMGRLEAVSGDITLISEVVINNGAIAAPDGSINLAAGREVIIQPSAQQKVFISVPSDQAMIENSGSVEAAQIEIAAAHDNPFALAINQSGIVRATGTQEIDGEVWLVADEGTVDISGSISANNADSSGGEILATGSRIAIQDGAVLEAEGNAADGGRVRIGGSRRGADDSIFHADRTFIAEGAEVSVDASGSGNSAGTVIAWGNDTLRMYGQLSARGTDGADGGFIETSAGWFDLGSAVPDVGSDTGNGGEWLIDPYDIVINDNGNDEFDDTTNPFDNPNTSDAELDKDTIIAALTSGSGVTVTIETGGGGSEDGNITVETDIDFNGIGTGDTLWLRANDEITLNANVNIEDSSGSDDSLSVVLQSDIDGEGDDGRIVLDTGSSINTNGGEIVISGGNYATLNDLKTLGMAPGGSGRDDGIQLYDASLNSGTGDITLRGFGGTYAGVRLRASTSIDTTTGNISIFGQASSGAGPGVRIENTSPIQTTGGDITIVGIGESENTGTSGFTPGVSINSDASLLTTGSGNIQITGTGSQQVNDSYNIGVTFSNSNILLQTENGDIDIDGFGGYGSESYGIFLEGAKLEATGTGDIILDGSGIDDAGITLAGSTYEIGDATMTGDITFELTAVSASNALNFAGSGSIITTGDVYLRPGEIDDTIIMSASTGGDIGVFGDALDRIDTSVSTLVIGRSDGTGSITFEADTYDKDVVVLSDTGPIEFAETVDFGSNNLLINSNGTVTQSDWISGAGLALAGSGTKTLTHASNNFSDIAAIGGSFEYANNNDIILNDVTIQGATYRGVAVSGDATITSGDDIFIDTDIDFNGIGTGNTLWLKATGEIELYSGHSIADSSGADDSLNIVFQSDVTGTGSEGRIQIETGGSISTNGGEIVFSGGNYSTLDDLRTVGLAPGGSGRSNGIDIGGGTLNAGTGDITLRGFGGTYTGVRIDGSSLVQTTTGDINIYGQASPDMGPGLRLEGSASIQSTGGDISIIGVGESDNTGSSSFSPGISLLGSFSVINTGDGNIEIHGTGSQQVNDSSNIGIHITGSTIFRAEDGDIDITGVSGYGSTSYGIYAEGTLIDITGSGNIHITGTSLESQGMVFAGSSYTIGNAAMPGDITLEATTDTGSRSINIAGSGDILTTGTVYLRPGDIADSVGIASASGLYRFATAQMNLIRDGVGTIVIGRSDGTGTITFEDYTFGEDLVVLSDTGDIIFDQRVDVGANNLLINSNGSVTQNDDIDGAGLVLLGSGTKTLTDSSNGFDSIAASGGSFEYVDTGDIDIDTVTVLGTTYGGVAVSGTAIITAGDDVHIRTNTDYNGIGSGNTLWLRADDQIRLEDNVTITDGSIGGDSLNIVFQGDLDNNGNGLIDLETGSVIETNGGEFILSGGNYSTLDDLRNLGFARNDDNFGVEIDGGSISTGTGNITIRGQGGTADTGVVIDNTFNIDTTTGDLTIVGTTGGTNDSGVVIETGSITSAGGDVSITGVGQSDNSGGGKTAIGVEIQAGAQILLTGDSNLTIHGTGGQAANDEFNYGVDIDGPITTLSVENGDLSITGIGGTGPTSYGIILRDEAIVTSTGSGDILISGTSNGASEGVYTDASTSIQIGGSSMTGDIIFEAATTSGSSSIRIDDQTLFETQGNLYLRPIDSTAAIGVGDGSAGEFRILDGDLGTFVDGIANIIIGRTDGTGAIDLQDASWNDPVTIQSMTGTITVNGTQTMSANDLTLSSDSIDLAVANSVTGTGTLYFQPGQTSTTIGLGDGATGTLNLDSTQLGRITDGFDTIVFGRTDGTGAIDIEALTFSDDVTLQSGSGTIDMDGALDLGTNDLLMNTTSTITQSAGITANTLTLNGSGATYTLTNSNNDVDTLAGNTGDIDFTNSDGLAIGTLNATSLDVVTTGAITNTGVIGVTSNATFKTFNDSGAAITLENASNTFGSISAQARNLADSTNSAANISITETGTADIALISTAGDFSFTADNTVTQSGAITASALSLNGSSGSYTLDHTGNDFNTLSGNTGNITLRYDDSLVIGTLSTSGNLDISASGSITDTGDITVLGNALFKTLDDSGAAITLDSAGNSFGSIFAESRNATDTSNSAGDISITSTGALAIAGINTIGDFELIADGTVTQSGAIQVDKFTVGGSGTYSLENTSNTVNELGGVSRGGAFSLYDSSGGLSISGAFSGTLTNGITIRTVGDMTLDSGASINTSGAGNNIVLEAAGGSFINNAGASALSTDSRYIIYSQDNESPHAKGGLDGTETFEVGFGSDPLGEGNVFYFTAAEPVVDEPVSETPDLSDPEPVTEEPVAEEPIEDVPEIDEPTSNTPDVPREEQLSGSEQTSQDSTEMENPQRTSAELREISHVDPELFLPVAEGGEANGGSGEVLNYTAPTLSGARGHAMGDALKFTKPPEPLDYYDERLELDVMDVESGLDSEEETDE
ncbi:MAG: filamentous hemagglutinin N-terminal domain-containing protein [Opitutales bacterium]